MAEAIVDDLKAVEIEKEYAEYACGIAPILFDAPERVKLVTELEVGSSQAHAAESSGITSKTKCEMQLMAAGLLTPA